MFSKLKGYLRRLSTPKKETNYQPKETSYGDIKVSYVGSVKVNNSLIHDSSIILQISYERNMQDADKDREQFLEMVSTTELSTCIIDIDKLNRRFLYIAGPICRYDRLCEYGYMLNYSDNKTLMKVMSILEKIDIMAESSTFKDKSKGKYTFPYTSDVINLTPENPVYVQCIDTYWIDKDIIDSGMNIFDYLKDILMVAILLKNQNYVILDTVHDFVKQYQTKTFQKYILDYIDEYKEDFASNFTIPGYKNIFDINFLVTNYNEDVDDIDELL